MINFFKLENLRVGMGSGYELPMDFGKFGYLLEAKVEGRLKGNIKGSLEGML